MKNDKQMFIAVVLGVLGISVGHVQAGIDYDFVGGSISTGVGTWNKPEDWDPSGRPVPGDTVTIGVNKTCTITNASGQNEACDSFTLSGTLFIEPDRTLTITQNSTVTGAYALLRLRGKLDTSATVTLANGGTVGMNANNITPPASYRSEIKGTGKIKINAGGGGLDGILVGAGDVKVDIENDGLLRAYSGSGASGPFHGNLDLDGDLSGSGSWEALQGGTLNIDSEVNDPTGKWSTYDSSQPSLANTIIFNFEVCITGDVEVGGTGGLEIKDDFCTSGHLRVGLGNASEEPAIKVYKDKVARFDVDNCCDG